MKKGNLQGYLQWSLQGRTRSWRSSVLPSLQMYVLQAQGWLHDWGSEGICCYTRGMGYAADSSRVCPYSLVRKVISDSTSVSWSVKKFLSLPAGQHKIDPRSKAGALIQKVEDEKQFCTYSHYIVTWRNVSRGWVSQRDIFHIYSVIDDLRSSIK